MSRSGMFRRERASAVRQHSHEEYGHNRSDGCQTDETEAVVFRVAAAYGSDPHAQRENEGNRHGAGGRASGVKTHAKKFRAGKGGTEKKQRIEKSQQPAQGNLKGHAQQRHADKEAYAGRNHEHQHPA